MSDFTRRLTTLTRHVAPRSPAGSSSSVAAPAAGSATTAFISVAAAAAGAAIAWSYDKTGYPRTPASQVPVPGSAEAAAAAEQDKPGELTPEQTPFVLLAHVKVHEQLLAEHMEFAERIDGIVRDSELGMLYHSLDQCVPSSRGLAAELGCCCCCCGCCCCCCCCCCCICACARCS